MSRITPLVIVIVLSVGGTTSRGGLVVLGEFSDPVLQGNILDPIAPHVSYYDNSSSAVYLIANSTDGTVTGTPPGQRQGSGLRWGDNPGFDGGFSYIQFFGKPVPSDPTVPFDLGTLIFGNGTSVLQSLIFGATITFYIGPDEPNSIMPGSGGIDSSTISIGTTDNLAVPGSEYHDADFLTLSGIANKSLNAFEGSIVSAELYGYILGDPVLTLTDIVLDPNQSANGFIGNGQVIAIPEPSSVLLLGTGILGILGYAWRTAQGHLAVKEKRPPTAMWESGR